MRFALVTLISAVAAALAQPTTQGPYPLNPPNVSPDFKGWDVAPAVKRAPVTNAERFAQGLPPLKSKARRHRGGPHHDPNYLSRGTRVRSAPRAETSPTPPVTTTCNILVKDDNGSELGYVSPTWNQFGEYGAVQQNQGGALLVSFTYPADSPSQLNMAASNPPSPGWSIVAAILGFSSQDSSLGPGQYTYTYLVGSGAGPAGTPQNMPSSYGEASGLDSNGESAIWSYDPATRDITAQWINPDGSAPTTYIGLTDDVFVLTGDIPTTADTLGVDITTVHFECVPLVTPV